MCVNKCYWKKKWYLSFPDKATQKKLATDSMYKLEHGSDDKQRGKSVIKTIGQIADERNQYKDDYIINKIAREKFRVLWLLL